MNIAAQSVTVVSPEASLDIRSMFNFVRRHGGAILCGAGISVIGAGGYLAVTPPEYTSSALVMVEARRANLPGSDMIIAEAIAGPTFVDSRAELLRSDRIPLSLLASGYLHIHERSANSGLISNLRTALGVDRGPLTEEDRLRSQVEAFQRKLFVRRVGTTNLLQISFMSVDRLHAANVANAVAQAFIADQLETRTKAEQRTSDWLETRANEVRRKAQAAELAVQVFKAEHEIIESRAGSLAEQQMNEISTELMRQRAQTVELAARLAWIDRLRSTGVSEAVSNAILKDDRISDMQRRYASIEKRISEISSQLSASHPAVANLESEKGQIEKAIQAELERVTVTSRNEFEISQAREKALEQSLGRQVDVIKQANQDRSRLGELESTARSLRSLQDKLLERLASISQQPEYPIAEAQIVSNASPALRKSHPRSLFILMTALLIGLGLGGVAGYIRDQMRRV
jgi:polysaccharide biosynthesis transport protein